MVGRLVATFGMAALVTGACGGEAQPGAETTDVAEVTPALPDFTVSILPSALAGNTPITVTFEAKAEGVALDRLALRWIVDEVLAGSAPTLTFPFYRAGASTVTLQADLRDEAGDVKTAEASVTLNLLGCADLQLDRFTLEFPTDVPPGAVLTVDVGRLRNEGDRIDGTFEVALALSVDDRWDPGIDRLVPGFEVDGMASGLATESALDLSQRTFVLPDDVVPGPYYAIAVADPTGVVNECQETNNHRVSTNSIVVDPAAGQKADLVLEDLALPTGLTVAQGENLTWSFTLRNGGEAEALQFRYAFWISHDTVLDRETDRPIVPASEEHARVQSMPAGFELGFFKSWQVPDDLEDGAYWVIGEVDATGVIAESDETNNLAITAQPFTMRFERPECYDFDLTSLDVAPLSTYWGGSVLVTAVVLNGGTLPTPDGWLMRAYLSLTQTLSPENAILVGTFLLDAIPAGLTKTYEIPVPIASNLPVIPHYLGVVIDPTGAFPECSESNNAKLFPEPVRISALAEVDLGVSDFVFHPQIVNAGESIKVAYQLANHGTTAATTFQVGVVLSADGSVTREGIAAGADVVIDRLTVPSLEPEEVRQVLRDVVIPEGLDHAVPEWTVAVMVDLDGFLTADFERVNDLVLSAARLVVEGAAGGCFEDELEDNDSRAQAALVAPADGERLHGLGSCGDEDWYLVDVPAGVSLAVDVTARAIVSVPETPGLLRVEIQDPRGTVASRATLGPSYQPRVFAVSEAGEYAIRVVGASTRDRAAYDLDLTFIPPVDGVDVVPFEVTAAPASAYAGGRLLVTWREANVGTLPAGARIGRVWLSRDRLLQPALDALLGEVALPVLPAQGVVQAEAALDLGGTLQPGTWYAIVLADADGAVDEVDEVGNVALGGPVLLDPLRVCHDDPLEPNDEPGIASELARVGVLNAVVCPGLEDWYGLELAVGDAAEVSITYPYESDKGRLVIELWAPDGQGAIATDGKNGSARVSLPYAYRAGRWLVRVSNDATLPVAPYPYEVHSHVGAGSFGVRCGAERYEPDDAPSGAGAIGCGTVFGELCNTDIDWYLVPGLAGERLRVQLTNASNQHLVELRAPGGTTALATIYGSGSMEYTPQVSGPLFLRVSPRDPARPMTTFDYALTASGIAGADLAVRDLLLELPAVDRGEDVGVGFAVQNQCAADTTSFEVTAWLSLDPDIDRGDLPLWWFVQPELRAGESLGFRQKVTVPMSTAPGLYQVIIEADSRGDVAEANEIDNTLWLPLEVREPCVADRFEPNDVLGEAVPMGEGEAAELTICPFDADWFAITATAGATVTVEVLFSQADGDLDLRVYDPLVSLSLPVAESTSTDDDEQATVPAPLQTTLYVRVSGYGGSTAPYDLMVTVER